MDPAERGYYMTQFIPLHPNRPAQFAMVGMKTPFSSSHHIERRKMVNLNPISQTAHH